jgi:hypothetical protein
MWRFFTRIRNGAGTAVELLRSMWHGRFWWLVPLIVFLLPVAVLFLFLQAVPLMAPFVYAVF